eukprot:7514799-Pyramimonas_sp.AAC.1
MSQQARHIPRPHSQAQQEAKHGLQKNKQLEHPPSPLRSPSPDRSVLSAPPSNWLSTRPGLEMEKTRPFAKSRCASQISRPRKSADSCAMAWKRARHHLKARSS